MPPKRKRVGAHPAPPQPDAPRRSMRTLKHQAAVNEARHSSPMDIDNTDGAILGKRETISEKTEDLQEAMRELSEMELQLQTAARRQRLAVEASDLHVEHDPSDIDLKPKPYTPARDSAFAQNFTTKPRPRDQTILDRSNVSHAKDAVVDSPEDDDAFGTGACRPPPVNSDILPLPWEGRLGYACLNTYLRNANPPVFSSRTCRISSIIEHRYPLQDPSQPEHPIKNRANKSKEPDVARGQAYLQELGLANAKDIVKMLRWNDKYNIKFMRLSSEMFPFASHEEHGYKLEPFASEVLSEAGKVAAKLGHRLTTHPGQYTQIASPRKSVVTAAIRDLEYHDEMLSLLKLPDQIDRDAVMILHMGGTYGDKAATLDRFRENYSKLSDSIKRRLVLENDDVSWSVHDLLPICEELNIPLVLDFHHHNIIFHPSMREGTHDIIELFDRIKKTWTRKGITQKMHYSEPTASAITPRERRKHSARVKTLPPCARDMDLMIEAKDKDQAVLELMRTYRLPGWDKFSDIIPYEREDEPRKAVRKKGAKRGKKKTTAETNGEEECEGYEIEIPEKINFLQWFKSLPGATFSDAIKIVDLRDRNAGRGIIALQDIEPETTLFTIPRKGIINTETSELPKKLPDVFDLNKVSDEDEDEETVPPMDSWSSLILVMIYEYLQGTKSSWKSYFDVLPSSFETPMFWPEEDLDQLQSSHMRSKVGKADAEDMFRGRLLPVIRNNSELFSASKSMSDDQLIEIAHRMGSTIMAYAFDLEKDDEAEEDEADGWVEDRDGKSLMGMVPMADILNADAEFNAHVNHEDESLTVTSLRPIKAGEEILNYYGPHPNSELLRRYGYVTDKHSRYDVVEIPWNVVESVMTTHFGISGDILEKLRCQLEEEEEFEDTFVLERETGDINPDGTFSVPARFDSIPEDLQEQLKTFLKGVKKGQPEAIPDKRKRDELQQAVQAKTLETLASRYPTSISEDELLLGKKDLPSRHRMAISVRLGEKKLLQEAIQMLSSDGDVKMTVDTETAPSKRAKRSG
ncbi:SET domain protein [Mariannaea sp. PMI_226]|nr:SET domain protein [Mariannaea sp. PMI_226]